MSLAFIYLATRVPLTLGASSPFDAWLLTLWSGPSLPCRWRLPHRPAGAPARRDGTVTDLELLHRLAARYSLIVMYRCHAVGGRVC